MHSATTHGHRAGDLVWTHSDKNHHSLRRVSPLPLPDWPFSLSKPVEAVCTASRIFSPLGWASTDVANNPPTPGCETVGDHLQPHDWQKFTIMDDVPQIYHLCPPRLLGEHLQPLNLLCTSYPELASKYVGREAIPRRSLPQLNCCWADCLQFSTVHPSRIRDAMIQTGHGWPDHGVRFLAIRSDSPMFAAGNTVIWQYTDTMRTDITKPKADVVPYTLNALAELNELQAGTLTYLRKMKGEGHRPLLFVGVPHVLHRDKIPLSLCNEIIV